VPRLERALSWIWPTSVVPAKTGATAAEEPVSWVAPDKKDAKQTMLPRAVTTPGREKTPPAPEVPCVPRQFTEAPDTGLLLGSTTVPVTVVNGSGTAMMTTVGAAAVAPEISRTEAPRIKEDTPVGTVKLKM